MPDTPPKFTTARHRARSLRLREAAAIAEKLGVGNPERLRELSAIHAVAHRRLFASG